MIKYQYIESGPSLSRATSVALAGDPGGTPGPVKVEDSDPKMSHSSVVRVVQDDPSAAVWTRSPFGSSCARRSEINHRFMFSDVLKICKDERIMKRYREEK